MTNVFHARAWSDAAHISIGCLRSLQCICASYPDCPDIREQKICEQFDLLEQLVRSLPASRFAHVDKRLLFAWRTATSGPVSFGDVVAASAHEAVLRVVDDDAVFLRPPPELLVRYAERLVAAVGDEIERVRATLDIEESAALAAVDEPEVGDCRRLDVVYGVDGGGRIEAEYEAAGDAVHVQTVGELREALAKGGRILCERQSDYLAFDAIKKRLLGRDSGTSETDALLRLQGDVGREHGLTLNETTCLPLAEFVGLLVELDLEGAAIGSAEGGMLPPRELAERFGIVDRLPALESRLRRWRAENKGEAGRGWFETSDRKPRQPQYLYRVSAVRFICEELARQATGE